MISVFLREQKRYTQEDLVKEFRCSEEKTVRILKRLKEYGVLKAVKANDTQKDLTDLLDEDDDAHDFYATFYTDAFLTAIKRWLREDSMPPERFVRLVHNATDLPRRRQQA